MYKLQNVKFSLKEEWLTQADRKQEKYSKAVVTILIAEAHNAAIMMA